ncbi:HET-domain-containing protein [Thozetella sp. PMI_491]|nr:HET-domain-containing protein [Thozetella sp. PMI_491]
MLGRMLIDRLPKIAKDFVPVAWGYNSGTARDGDKKTSLLKRMVTCQPWPCAKIAAHHWTSSKLASAPAQEQTLRMRATAQIRVLDLFPLGPGEDESAAIQCETRSIQLSQDEAPEAYEALSYVWGDQTALVPIHISGQEVLVTPSLLAAIRRLRLRDRRRTLWIDQLCINQWDNKEKAQQVRLMRNIYSSCSQCTIWLGEIPQDKGFSLADAAAAIDIIDYIASASRLRADRVSFLTPACLADDTPASASSLERAVTALQYFTFVRNPWWRRLWTVQEAALPETAVVVWGSLRVDWDTLRRASQVWTGSEGYVPEPVWKLIILSARNQDAFSGLMVSVIWLDVSRSRGECPLFLLHRWRGREASEPRDKIYGLLGLLGSTDGLTASKNCDYDLPIDQVYSAMMVDLIVDEGGLRPLVADPRSEPDRATPNMPGWSLDMKGCPQYGTDWYHLYGYYQYRANQGLEQMDLAAFRSQAAQAGYKVLEMKGVLVDRVREVHEARMLKEGVYVANEPFRHNLSAWLASLAASKADEAGEAEQHDRREEFARLVLGDVVRDSNQYPERTPTREDIESVAAFMRGEQIEPVLQMSIFGMIRNQAFFVTEQGRIGLGHLDTHPRDEIWIFRSGQVPFMLRARGRPTEASSDSAESDYQFVGRCYVQGIMYGEALQRPGLERPEERTVRVH